MKRSVFLAHILTACQQENRPLEALLQEVHAMGYDGVDAAYTELQRENMPRLLAEAGLAVASVYLFCSFETGFDAEEMQTFLQRLSQWGCRSALIIPGYFTPQGDRETEMQAMIEGLRRTCEMAKPYGITVTVEDFGHVMSPCMRLDDLKRLLDEIPLLQMNFDTGNFLFDGVEVLAAFDALEDRIHHVHLKDRTFQPATAGDVPDPAFDGRKFYSVAAGSGVLPMAQILHRLKAAGYEGYAAVEHFGAQNEWEYIRRSARWLESILGEKTF